MDDYFAGQEMRPADMVKIDVEGAELSVLEGMTGLFEAGVRPILPCEVRGLHHGFGFSDALQGGSEPMAFPTLAFIPSARSHE